MIFGTFHLNIVMDLEALMFNNFLISSFYKFKLMVSKIRVSVILGDCWFMGARQNEGIGLVTKGPLYW